MKWSFLSFVISMIIKYEFTKMKLTVVWFINFIGIVNVDVKSKCNGASYFGNEWLTCSAPPPRRCSVRGRQVVVVLTVDGRADMRLKNNLH